MAKKRQAHLKVVVDGKRRYIAVPSGRAAALHAYLRSKRVVAAPPTPSYTGFDSIELAEGRDITAVQEVLKGWF
jgi:hypothetical protein